MITRLITTAVLLLLAVSLHAQDAQVIQLSDGDAHAASDAYNALMLAQNRWNAVKTGIQTKYVTPAVQGEISQYVYPADNGAWSNGFEFSVGFKFIVPAPPKPPLTTWPLGGQGTIPGTAPIPPCPVPIDAGRACISW